MIDPATGAQKYEITDAILLLTNKNTPQQIGNIGICIDKTAVPNWMNAAGVRLRFARMFCQSDVKMKVPDIETIKKFIATPGAKIRYEEDNRIIECTNGSYDNYLSILMIAYDK